MPRRPVIAIGNQFDGCRAPQGGLWRFHGSNPKNVTSVCEAACPWQHRGRNIACYESTMQSNARTVEYRAPHPIRVLRIREDEPSNGRRGGHASPEPETAAQWASVHAALVDLGRQRSAHERDVCRWLLAAERLSVHARAGYASLREYAERVLGLKPRQTEERLRVGRALAQLPVLDAALASGELAWTAVREITRVATRQTEEAWLAWARPQRVHQVERAVAARLPGDGPSARPDPSRIKHRLSFEVRAETMALSGTSRPPCARTWAQARTTMRSSTRSFGAPSGVRQTKAVRVTR